MTILMDRFFISIGFDAMEIKASTRRGALYIAMVYTLGIATAFMIMAIIGG